MLRRTCYIPEHKSERLLDALKEDLNRYIEYVETIPLEIKKTVNVEVNYNDSKGNRRTDIVPVEVEIPNVEVRLKGVKDVQTYREMYSKLEQQADRDQKIKQTQSRLFEGSKCNKDDTFRGLFCGRKMNVMVLTAIIETA